jgi:hypothetical protein
MLFQVEWAWIEKSSDRALSRDYQSHELSKNIGDDSQKDDRDINRLRFEVEDFLKDRSKD